MKAIKEVHKIIVEEEKIAANMHLIIAYYRGMLYLAARTFAGREANIRERYDREFSVPFATVSMLFAMHLKAYPGLLVCGLSFTQMTKHYDRLLKHLSEEPDLSHKL